MEDIVIYGASGFGREVSWLIESSAKNKKEIRQVCFIDDDADKQGQKINDYRVLSLDEAKIQFPEAKVVSGIGIPKIREKTIKKSINAGYKSRTLIHPDVRLSKWVDFGEGVIICAGNIITTNILLGNQVQINLNCTIGHDVVLGKYTTLSPGVNVSGWVHFGSRVFVGTGAAFINGTRDDPLTIGHDAVIGAGACVTKSIPPGEIWGGVPAKKIK